MELESEIGKLEGKPSEALRCHNCFQTVAEFPHPRKTDQDRTGTNEEN